ncbi:MAG: nucleoside monophosphate kinase [Candidatus Aenigmarchaeota archaeon]|nr:nucleoside monophosphate kinase [Candidatus Aenigmarchaeota archaeon]
MNIIILGPQGSGKGTQSGLLSKRLGVPCISSGDLLRSEISRKTALGKKIKSIIESGRLAPDNITLGLILKRIGKHDCKNGFILDGYPRNKQQLEDLKKNIGMDILFRINIPDKEAVKRLSSRRQCKKCGAIYNIITMKPKAAGKCDKCGSALVQREDDKPSSIKKRLHIYHNETKAVFDYFAGKGILAEINGEQSIEKVFSDIMKELEKWRESR